MCLKHCTKFKYWPQSVFHTGGTIHRYTNGKCPAAYLRYMTWKTFSSDDRTDNPHIAAWLSAYVRADNQRILCGTISGFRAEFCGCKTKITQSENVLPAQLALTLLTIFLLCFFRLSVLSYSYFLSRSIPIMIIQTILATCFSILQPVVAHEVRLLVSAIFNPNPHGRSTPARMKNLCPPAWNPHPPARKFRDTRAENPRRSAQLSAGVHAEQPRNSSEKVKFSVSCTVRKSYRCTCKQVTGKIKIPQLHLYEVCPI